MRCSYCSNEAEFKCRCQYPYMCGIHLGTHMKTLGKHEFEILENERRRKVEEGRSKKEKEEGRKKEKEERRRKEEEESLHPERSKSYIEMTLKQKIDYYHPIVFSDFGLDLNFCYEFGREALVSENRKYLFFCKLHLGI